MKKYLKFWGTRGSCSVSGSEYLHFGGNTCCLEIRYENTLIIIDAGTGIRPLGDTILKEKDINIFLSHMHWDHIIGFPFFEPLYRKDTKITIWSPHQEATRSQRTLFDELLAPEFFPVHFDEVQAQLEFRTIEEKKQVEIGPIKLDFHVTNHPSLTFCFKIITPLETIGYVTDNDVDLDTQQSFVNFHKGCNYFVHEAQYTHEEYLHKEGWGHSSLTNVLKLVEQVQPAHWIVTHHDPSHTDSNLIALENSAKSHKVNCPVEWIQDGHVLHLK